MRLFSIVFLLISVSAYAYADTTSGRTVQKTYRPEELQGMIRNGNYPNQGPVSTQSQTMDFHRCKEKISSVIDAIGPNYPRKILVDTTLLFTEKLWTNDAGMTLSCSLLDNKLVMTTAPYR